MAISSPITNFCHSRIARSLLSVVIFFFWPFLVQSQTLTIVDAQTKEGLIGVTIFTDDYETFTGTTDIDGKVNIPSLPFREMINFTFIGYSDVKLPYYELNKKGWRLEMSPSQSSLDTLVIVGRKDEVASEIPYQNQRIAQAEIEFKNPQNSADALAAEAGVFVQKSQMGGGSPIIRGFEANRVLLVVDGVRMNNAIYRSGHLQNSITVDNAMLEQIEVIYGPGSLTYGSDALGGVVHFRTKDPKLLFGGNDIGYRMSSNLNTRFSTANLEKTFHYDLNYGNHDWGSVTSFSYSQFGDLRAGENRSEEFPDLGKREFYAFRNGFADEVIQSSDVNVQNGTAYSQYDIFQKIKIKTGKNSFLVLNGQFSSTSDIPRYDQLYDTLGTADVLKFSEWYYGPQNRILGSARLNVFRNYKLFSKATIIASFQKIDEDRFSRRFGRSNLTSNREDVNVYALTMDFSKDLDQEGRNVLSYGFDGSYNTVSSTIREQSVLTKRETPGRDLTRYPSGGSEMQSLGSYINYRWSSRGKKLFFDIGARYSNIEVTGKYLESDSIFINWEPIFFSGITNENQDVSGAFGITWNSDDNWQFRGLLSKAFRAPNVDDLFKNRVKNDQALLPNASLRPETAISTEATLSKTFVGKNDFKWLFSATGYYTIIKDVIVRKNGTTPSGATQILGDGGQTLYDVQQNINSSEGYIYGLSTNTQLNIGKGIFVSGGVNYTKGETAFEVISSVDGRLLYDTISPLAHIPPLYGKASIGYRGQKWRIEMDYRFNGKKAVEDYAITSILVDEETNEVVNVSRVGSSDNLLDSGTCIDDVCIGTPAWSTFNIYSSFKLGKIFSIDFAAENILDVHYRPFSSGVSAPGRNFILGLRAKF